MTIVRFRVLVICCAMASFALPLPAVAATASQSVYGKLADSTEIEGVTLTGSNEMSAAIVTYGAISQAFNVRNRNGMVADITPAGPLPGSARATFTTTS